MDDGEVKEEVGHTYNLCSSPPLPKQTLLGGCPQAISPTKMPHLPPNHPTSLHGHYTLFSFTHTTSKWEESSGRIGNAFAKILHFVIEGGSAETKDYAQKEARRSWSVQACKEQLAITGKRA